VPIQVKNSYAGVGSPFAEQYSAKARNESSVIDLNESGIIMVGKKRKRSPINCRDFSQKLSVIYEAVGRKAGYEKPNNDTELAELIGVAKSTVSTWRNGAVDKNRERHYVSPDDISELSKIFTNLTQHVTAQEAHELWSHSDADSFRRRLLDRHDKSILKYLTTREPTLKITPYLLADGLGLITEEYEPEEGDWKIEEGSRFCLSVNSKKGRVVIILSNGETGLLWLSPSAYSHDGRVKSIPEIIPNNRTGWPATLLGKSDLYCIEMTTRTPPYIRPKVGSMFLSKEVESRLVDELQDERLSGNWRWCKIPIFVSKR